MATVVDLLDDMAQAIRSHQHHSTGSSSECEECKSVLERYEEVRTT